MSLLLGMWEEPNTDEEEEAEQVSLLRSMSSVNCQCIRCQQRPHRMLSVPSGSIVMLPGEDDEAKWKWFQQIVVDTDSLHYLNQKRIMNWCAGTRKLYPMKTTGIVYTANSFMFM